MDPYCENCRYFLQPLDGQEEFGFAICHRYPEGVKVSKHYGCGEFQPNGSDPNAKSVAKKDMVEIPYYLLQELRDLIRDIRNAQKVYIGDHNAYQSTLKIGKVDTIAADIELYWDKYVPF